MNTAVPVWFDLTHNHEQRQPKDGRLCATPAVTWPPASASSFMHCLPFRLFSDGCMNVGTLLGHLSRWRRLSHRQNSLVQAGWSAGEFAGTPCPQLGGSRGGMRRPKRTIAPQESRIRMSMTWGSGIHQCLWRRVQLIMYAGTADSETPERQYLYRWNGGIIWLQYIWWSKNCIHICLRINNT